MYRHTSFIFFSTTKFIFRRNISYKSLRYFFVLKMIPICRHVNFFFECYLCRHFRKKEELFKKKIRNETAAQIGILTSPELYSISFHVLLYPAFQSISSTVASGFASELLIKPIKEALFERDIQDGCFIPEKQCLWCTDRSLSINGCSFT